MHLNFKEILFWGPETFDYGRLGSRSSAELRSQTPIVGKQEAIEIVKDGRLWATDGLCQAVSWREFEKLQSNRFSN